MKKLFISQPMQGKSDEEILFERNEAIVRARNIAGEEIEVIDSFFQSAPIDPTPLWYLAKSIELLSVADLVYFVDGWDKARGCLIEHECAVQYGLTIIRD